MDSDIRSFIFTLSLIILFLVFTNYSVLNYYEAKLYAQKIELLNNNSWKATIWRIYTGFCIFAVTAFIISYIIAFILLFIISFMYGFEHPDIISSPNGISSHFTIKPQNL
jgi:hypothetical protein